MWQLCIVGIVSRCGLELKHFAETALYKYKLLFSSFEALKQLCTSNEMQHFSYEGGCGGIHVSRHSKEEQTWATDNGFSILVILCYRKQSYQLGIKLYQSGTKQ